MPISSEYGRLAEMATASRIVRELDMSAQTKKSLVWTTVLIVFGLTALFVGMKVLIVLIPAALLIWYEIAQPMLDGDRN
jgi:hypothetical protein